MVWWYHTIPLTDTEQTRTSFQYRKICLPTIPYHTTTTPPLTPVYLTMSEDNDAYSFPEDNMMGAYVAGLVLAVWLTIACCVWGPPECLFVVAAGKAVVAVGLLGGGAVLPAVSCGGAAVLWLTAGLYKEQQRAARLGVDPVQNRPENAPWRRAEAILRQAQRRGDNISLQDPLLPLTDTLQSEEPTTETHLEQGLSTFDRLMRDISTTIQEDKDHLASAKTSHRTCD